MNPIIKLPKYKILAIGLGALFVLSSLALLVHAQEPVQEPIIITLDVQKHNLFGGGGVTVKLPKGRYKVNWISGCPEVVSTTQPWPSYFFYIYSNDPTTALKQKGITDLGLVASAGATTLGSCLAGIGQYSPNRPSGWAWHLDEDKEVTFWHSYGPEPGAPLSKIWKEARGEVTLAIYTEAPHPPPPPLEKTFFLKDLDTKHPSCPALVGETIRERNQVFVDLVKAAAGEQIRVWGKLRQQPETIRGRGLENATVKISINGPSPNPPEIKVRTGVEGFFTGTFTPREPGRYRVRVVYEGDERYEPSAVEPVDVEVQGMCKKPVAYLIMAKLRKPLWGDYDIMNNFWLGFTAAGYDARLEMNTEGQMTENDLRRMLQDPCLKALVFHGHTFGFLEIPIVGQFHPVLTLGPKLEVGPQDILSWNVKDFGSASHPRLKKVGLQGCASLMGKAKECWAEVFSLADITGWSVPIFPWTMSWYWTPNEVMRWALDKRHGVPERPAVAVEQCPVSAQAPADEPHHLFPGQLYRGLPKKSHTVKDILISGLPENGDVNVYVKREKAPEFFLSLRMTNGKVNESLYASRAPVLNLIMSEDIIRKISESSDPEKDIKAASAAGEIRLETPWPVLAGAPIKITDYLHEGCLTANGETMCWKKNKQATTPVFVSAVIAKTINTHSTKVRAMPISDDTLMLSSLTPAPIAIGDPTSDFTGFSPTKEDEEKEVEPEKEAEKELPDPGLTPDSPLYFLDTAGKNISLFFTFNPIKKSEKALQYAEERVAETVAMAMKNKGSAVRKAALGYQGFLTIANNKAKEAKERGMGKEAEVLGISLVQKTMKHQGVFMLMFEKVSQEAKDEIKKTAEVASQESEKALEALPQEKQGEFLLKIEEAKVEAEARAKEEEKKTKEKEAVQEPPAPAPTTPSVEPSPPPPTQSSPPPTLAPVPTPITAPIPAKPAQPTVSIEVTVKDLKIISDKKLDGLKEGDKVTFKAMLVLSDGSERELAAGKVTWQVTGTTGNITSGGVFTAKLDESIAEYGEGFGSIVATYEDETSGKTFLGKTEIFKVEGYFEENLGPQEGKSRGENFFGSLLKSLMFWR